MKKIYFFFSILLCSLVTIAQTQMNVPVTFDDATVNYGLVGFGGAEQATVVTDPTLVTNKVGKVIKTNTAELWAGASITALAGTVQTSFANPIPFTASERKMNVRVWSPHTGISIKLKVEDKTDPTKSCETDALFTGAANTWQTLEFNFNNQSAGTSAFNAAFTYNKASIFFNFGVTGATAGERIYYFDDVKLGAAGGGGGTSTLPVLPLDFESATINYTFTDFAGGAVTKIANPQINGINTSANVGKMIKSVGEVYGGSFITLDAPINFSVNKTFKVKVFSPRVGAKLLLKVENASDGSINFEKEATSTVANAWEDLTFDYSTISTTAQYSKLIFIFDLGTMGNGTANYTWLFDDVRLITTGGGGGLTQMNVPVTFDDATVNYGLVGFGGAEQATVVTDPTLATNKVGKVIKTNTAELWAGVSVTALAGTVQTSFANAIPFTATERRMNVRVWSPHAGIQVRLKIEDKTDGTKSCETEATVTVASGWQTLEFNFNNQAAGTAAFNPAFTFNKASIFFNFGVTGATAGERIYYFDDVKFGAATGGGTSTLPVLPLDFESATINYTFTDFAGGAVTKIANTQINGINMSANVGKMVKSVGEVYGGSFITLDAPMNFSVNKTFKVKVFSPRVGAKLLLKVENATDGSINFEKEATSTVANAWEDLTFDYSTISTTAQYSKLIFIFDLGTMGNGTANYTWLFDDVRLTTTGGGGGLTQMNVPVTFDDATVNYGLVGFGGAEQATVVTDPTLATNKVGKVIKTNTAELWAGVSVTALAGTVQTSFANAIPFTATERRMNVRVWSPHAGIQVRLKIEDKTDGTKSCETEATVTVASGWQTLEFNFNNQAAGTAAFNPAFTFNKASIFFNFGVTGATAGERIYYFDDVKFGAAAGTTLTQMNVPVTFDDATVNYGLVGFGGAEQATVVTDPTLATNKVGKVIKTNTAELWAGVSITALAGTVQTSFANAIPFTATERRMNVRVWSPHAGIQVRLKIEDKTDGTKSCETEATVTVASGWQTLEFNFNNQAAGTAAFNPAFTFNKASIFFNFGVTGATAGERIYYFDDVKFGAATATSVLPVIPIDFESATINYAFTDFNGGGTTKIANPQISGINTSATVAKMIKSVGEVYGGSFVTLASPINFSVNKIFKVKVFSPRVGAKLLVKVENAADGNINFEREATSTVANAWEDLTFDYTAISTTNVYDKLVVIFDLGTMGNGTANYTWLFDDIRLTTPTVPTLTQMNVPVTFDDATVNYGLVGFAGAEQATVVIDPTLATNKVAKVIKTNTAELYAGVSITALNGTIQTSFANNIPFAIGATKMNVRVWSPHTGIQVRLKVEDKNDPTKSCETEATFTGAANTWQVLEFNFANQATGTAPLNVGYNLNKATIFFNFGVTGTTAGERIYYFDDVKFGAIAAPITPAAPVVVSPANFCQNSTAALTATATTGNVLVWYTVATAGVGSTTAPTISTTATGTPIATYYVSQRNAALVEGPRATIVVNVNATPIAPTAATPFTYCQNAMANVLTATAATGNTLKWYTSLTGTGSTSAITPSNTNAGTTNYYVSQTNSFGCESPKATIVVVTNPTATAPATSALNYCQNIVAPALTATAAAGNTLKWYSTSTGGTATAAPSPTTAAVGTIPYYVSQINSFGCESPRATLNVTVKTSPAAPSVVSPLAYCLNATSTILSATADAGNNLLWYNAATGGTGSVNIPTTITNVSGNVSYYVSQTNAQNCESPRALIDVNIVATPTVGAIAASPYTKLYPGLTTSIAVANAPAVGNIYSWYRNGVLITGQTGKSVNANIDGLGNYTLKVTNANGCVGTSNMVVISDDAQEKMFVYPNPSTGKFQVRYFSNATDLKPRKMLIFDAAGKNVYTASFVMFAGYTAMNVDLTSVNAGVYLIHLLDNDGTHLVTERVLIKK